MSFERDVTIYNFDLDRESNVKPSAIMHYLQQLALSDCDNVGMTYEKMRDAGQVFVLTKSLLELYRPFHLYDNIHCITWPKCTRGCTFERHFLLERNGEKLAACSTQWVLIDYVKRRILRPSQLIGRLEDRPDLDCGVPSPGKFSFDLPLTQVDSRTVYYSMIDENRHLNNCFYSDIALDYTDNKAIKSIQINYLEEAYEGDRLDIYKAVLPSSCPLDGSPSRAESPSSAESSHPVSCSPSCADTAHPVSRSDSAPSLVNVTQPSMSASSSQDKETPSASGRDNPGATFIRGVDATLNRTCFEAYIVHS